MPISSPYTTVARTCATRKLTSRDGHKLHISSSAQFSLVPTQVFHRHCVLPSPTYRLQCVSLHLLLCIVARSPNAPPPSLSGWLHGEGREHVGATLYQAKPLKHGSCPSLLTSCHACVPLPALLHWLMPSVCTLWLSLHTCSIVPSFCTRNIKQST